MVAARLFLFFGVDVRFDEGCSLEDELLTNKSLKKGAIHIKRTIIKITLCVILYLVIYFIKNSNYFFSNDVINKTNEILSYDINLYKMYCDCSETVEDLYNNLFNIKKENIEVPQNEQLNSKSNEIEVKSIESEEDYEKQNKKENKDENIKEGTE